METTYCDKCKKKVKGSKLNLYFWGNYKILDENLRSIDLCEVCGKKVNKILQKFMKIK